MGLGIGKLHKTSKPVLCRSQIYQICFESLKPSTRVKINETLGSFDLFSCFLPDRSIVCGIESFYR